MPSAPKIRVVNGANLNMPSEIDLAGLEAALRLVPMCRYGKPGEIAAAMAFLAPDDAAYITGQTLRVNGGMSMGS
jgi:NAD(P)-dependent dehydrogenase (short-subunit alcohol dehydrogenase family)